MMLMTGLGKPQDSQAAIAYFRKGMASDDKNAYWLLGK
jgi:TPR repeat protein